MKLEIDTSEVGDIDIFDALLSVATQVKLGMTAGTIYVTRKSISIDEKPIYKATWELIE